MRKQDTNKYAGFIYEMQQEINEGKDFMEARQETAVYLRKKGDVAGSRMFSYIGQAEFLNAYNQVKEEQAVFG